jgi:acyl carrier protein
MKCLLNADGATSGSVPLEPEMIQSIHTIFVELFEIKPERLTPQAKLFEELGLDSLDAIDLVVSFERVFKIKPPHSEVRDIRTLSDVYSLVQRYYGLENVAAS